PRQGLVQVREVGDDAGDTGKREDPENGAGGYDQQQLTTAGQGSLLGPYQHPYPRRIAKPGAGHVHPHPRPPARPRPPQYPLDPLGFRGVDVHRGSPHGNAADHHEWVPGISHWCHLPPWPLGRPPRPAKALDPLPPPAVALSPAVGETWRLGAWFTASSR